MTDSVLIIGSGIAGLTAAQQVSAAGARAIVVEQQPIIGGRLAATMTKAHAIGERAEGEPVPLFEALTADANIELLTNATLAALDGRQGNFTASIRQRARFVTDACTRCKNCHAVCPVVLPNEFDAGLTFRKAIYTPMVVTWPQEWAIDIANCLNTPPNYLPCNRCVSVCDDNAIHFDQPLETMHERHVGAVILAPGMQIESGEAYVELGYGAHPDIVTSAEMQRLLESPGPTGGFATRPSNEEYPASVLIVLDNPSPFTLYIAASQARQLLDQDIETVAVLVLSQPAGGDAARQLTERTGIEVHWGTAFQAKPADDGTIAVSFEDFGDKRYQQQSYEMVVLCVDVTPPGALQVLAETTGIDLGPDGYLALAGGNGSAIETTRQGIFVAGCGSGPKNIRDSMAAARSAADAAVSRLNPILLGGEATEAPAPPSIPEDALRAQIEKLLNALIAQPDR